MTRKARFINSVVETAKADTPAMPWTRGARRAAFIAKRNAMVLERKAA